LVQSSWAIGWALAAILFFSLTVYVPAEQAWHWMFWSGLLPALLVVYIRKKLTDPDNYQTRSSSHSSPPAWSFLLIFKQPYLKTTLLASLMATGMQGAYYGITTWLPTYLKTERHLSVLGSSSYLLILIAGSFVGYLSSGWFADRFGRRVGFIGFACAGALLVLCYTQWPITDGLMLFLGFPLGFFLSGIFSGMGAYLTELFPHECRGSAQGFCYNSGRAIGAVCPAAIGALSAQGQPLGSTLGLFAAVFYGLVIVTALLLPETKHKPLTSMQPL
jgi:MFS family permease